MGKFRDYYEQLRSKMAGQPPMNLQEAVAALRAEQQAAVPEAPRSEEEQKRLDYSRKCSDQIMDRAAEKIRKEAAWEAAVKSVSKRSETLDLQVSRGADDWLVSMMKTGDDWQDQAYNAVLVAQVAFCTGQIRSKDVALTYQGIRLYYDAIATYESIQNDFLASIYNAPRQILEELNKKIEQGQQELTQLDSSADAILSGEAGDNVVESSYRTLESDAIDLLLNAKDALEDIKVFEKALPEKYQNKIPAAELEQRQKELLVPDKARVDAARERAEQAADPSYALQKQQPPAAQNDVEVEEELPKAYGQADIYNLRKKTLDDYLDPYGLGDLDRIWTNDSGYSLYQNKRGDAVIIQLEEIKADDGGVSFAIHDDAPGRYVTHNLAKRTDSAVRSCKRLEREDADHPHTREYLELWEKLNALRDIQLGDRPGWTEVTEAVARFDDFKKSLERFDEAQKRRPDQEKNHQKEKDRESAFKELKTFAKGKLSDLEALADHIATGERIAKKAQEIGDAVRAARTEFAAQPSLLSSPDDYMSFAMKWYKTMGQTLVDRDKRLAAAAKMTTKVTEVGGRTEQRVEFEASDKSFSEIGGIFDAFENSVDELDKQDGAAMKAMLGDKLFQSGVNGKLLPEELADVLAKNALACGVVKEMLELESNTHIMGEPTIKELIDGGKLSQVVDMVKNSQSFGENYRSLYLSDASEEQLKDILTGKAAQKDGVPHPREIAQDIMKSYLTRQRQAAQNAKAPAKQNAPVAEPVAGKQPQPKFPH